MVRVKKFEHRVQVMFSEVEFVRLVGKADDSGLKVSPLCRSLIIKQLRAEDALSKKLRMVL